MLKTPDEYKQFRKGGESFQAVQREEERRQNIDNIERQKDRKLQYLFLKVSIISVIITVIVGIFSIIK